MRRSATVVSTLLLGLALGSPATSQAPTEFKLTASDAAAGDSFGWSVALDGDLALVGAWHDGDAGRDSGSAYVFVRSGTTWSQKAKLTASDAGQGDRFGWSVALSGETAVVGAPGNDDAGTSSGSAYVFVRSSTGWVEQAKLTASDAAERDNLGHSVALSGDTALVGALFDNIGSDYSQGSAYVFRFDGTNWNEEAKLTASDAARAKRVIVVSVGGVMVPGPNAGAMARYLKHNGITAQLRELPADSRGGGAAVLAEAKSLGADLLVKGAFTQSRLRQMIFGGATSHILATAEIPVLMAH